MKKIILSSLCILLCVILFTQKTDAQFSLVHGGHVMEIGGWINSTYTYRYYDASVTDHKKNGFTIDDARVLINGQIKSGYEYQFEYDIASIIPGVTDVASHPLVNANITLKQLKYFYVKAGYQKLPFSFNSEESSVYNPFNQRIEMANGDVYSRRDVGITLFRDYLNQTLNVAAGAYTGMGEASIAGNDASGKLEYVGRIDYAYPSKFRHRFVDVIHTPTPQIMVGLNGRYSNKQTFTGNDLIKTIVGEKYVYGGDVSFMYKGFSFQLESEQIRLQPWDKTKLTPYNLKYYLAGGMMVEGNYYITPLKTAVSLRYDTYNPSNIVLNDTRSTVGTALNYFLSDYKSEIKIQYLYRLPVSKSITTPWKENQLSVTYQWLF